MLHQTGFHSGCTLRHRQRALEKGDTVGCATARNGRYLSLLSEGVCGPWMAAVEPPRTGLWRTSESRLR